MNKMEIIRLPRLNGERVCCCLFDCIATVCKYYGESIYWIFHDCMKVEYNQNNSKMALQNINIMQNWGFRLKKYYGLTIKPEYFDHDIINKLKEVLKNGKIIFINFNVYWMPWSLVYHNPQYERGHTHYFIIEKILDETREVVCVDPFHNKDEVKIAYEEFVEGYQSHLEIYRMEQWDKVKKGDILLEKQKGELKRLHYWHELQQFMIDLLEEIQCYKKQENTTSYLKYVEEIMRLITYRCYYFACYLEFVSGYENDAKYNKALDYSLQIYDQWELIGKLISKYLLTYKEDDIIERIESRSLEAIEMERKLFQIIQ